MKTRNWLTSVAGLLLVLVSVWQIATVTRGLEVVALRSTDPPLVIITPAGPRDASRPLVLVAHGLAGSTVIMRGFGLTLAHAGYTAVLWDFDGHGANPNRVPSSVGNNSLLSSAEAALVEATARGYGDPARVAILGHSMGTAAALVFGQEHPETAATIAVSPVGVSVSPDLPKNLLLMAGALEPRFLRNAEERLAEAGGAGGSPQAGTARELLVVPGVEHISILFSPAAHSAARAWLDATLGLQPGAVDYVDRRVVWYGLGVLGALLLGAGLAPVTADPTSQVAASRPVWWRLAALAAGGLLSTLLLWLLGLAGLDLRSLLGMNVGGYLMIWFGLAGLLAQTFLWIRPRAPSRRALLGAILAFSVLWLGVGLLAQWVWLPWLLIPGRLVLWPLAVLLLLPWFLAAGETVQAARLGGRLGWWLAHSLVLLGALGLAVVLTPELGFLFLLLPLFPAVLGLHALAAAPQCGVWPFALSGALFVGWLLLAVFPLV